MTPPCSVFRPLKAVLTALFFLPLLLAFVPVRAVLAAETQAPLAADLVQDGQLIDLDQEKYLKLFKELREQHGFTEAELLAMFKGVTIDREVLRLMDRQWEAKPYHTYRTLFVTLPTIVKGRELLARHKALLDRIEAEFGVDREVVLAIWAVETRYGANQGRFEVFRTLNTLFDAYPRRSDFFRRELIHFLLLCRENQMSPRGVMGSYAGAFGQPQFIPSSFRKYAVSFDGDSKRDVWNSIPDILASIANYLKRSGWTLNAPVYADIGFELKEPRLAEAEAKGRKGRVAYDLVVRAQGRELPPSPQNKALSIIGLELPSGAAYTKRYVAGYPNFQAITEWNHSNRYAMAVSELAEALAAVEKHNPEPPPASGK